MMHHRIRYLYIRGWIALLSALAWQGAARAGEEAAWLKGWPYRVQVTAVGAKSGSYDVLLRHDGLAQADARDLRVISPGGKPVSHLIVFAADDRARVLFDAADGPGSYRIYFGNLSPELPAVPDGVASLGRRDWAPVGGYTCSSYDAFREFAPKDLASPAQVRQAFDNVRQQAIEADRKARSDASAAPRAPSVRQHVYRGTEVELPPPIVRDTKVKTPLPFHVFRAQVAVTNENNYDFGFANIGDDDNLVALAVLDGNWSAPLVPGWFSAGNWGLRVSDRGGRAHLSVGKHVLEIYTVRRYLHFRWKRSQTGERETFLTGLDADFDDAQKLAPGAIEADGGRLATAYVTTIGQWLEQGRCTKARRLSRLARTMFSQDGPVTDELDKLYERAEQTAYADNWLTEGRLASRAGAVDTPFLPPLVMQAPRPLPTFPHDNSHISSAAWVEDRLVYGLPFDIQKDPWAVTSGICVFDDTVYVGTKNGIMHAVSLTTGLEKWSFPGEGSCRGTPLLYRNMLFYGALDGRLYALDVQNGRMLWNYPSSDWVEASPCAADGRVYFASRDRHVYAVDASSGVERWEAKLDGEIVATPCLDDGRLYVGTRAGSFYALGTQTGGVAWTYAAGAPIVAGACVGRGRVCFGDTTGKVHCLDAATGKRVGGDTVEVGGPVVAAPILVGTIVYGGTANGKLFGIDSANNTPVWHADIPENQGLGRQPLFAKDKLIFVTAGKGLVLTFERGQP